MILSYVCSVPLFELPLLDEGVMVRGSPARKSSSANDRNIISHSPSHKEVRYNYWVYRLRGVIRWRRNAIKLKRIYLPSQRSMFLFFKSHVRAYIIPTSLGIVGMISIQRLQFRRPHISIDFRSSS